MFHSITSSLLGVGLQLQGESRRGERRADAVAKHLVSAYGVDPKVLKPVGRGKDELRDAARPDSEVNRRVDNRAEVFLLDSRSQEEEIPPFLEAARHVDYVLLALAVRARSGAGRIALPEAARRAIEALPPEKKIIAVSFGSPYIIRELPSLETYFAAYGIQGVMQQAAVRAIFGEAGANGTAVAHSLALRVSEVTRRPTRLAFADVLAPSVGEVATPPSPLAAGGHDTVRAAQRGDRAAQERVFAALYPLVRKQLYFQHGSSLQGSLDEAVQESMMTIFRALPIRVEGADGPADPPLSAAGHRQSRALAEWLARNPKHEYAAAVDQQLQRMDTAPEPAAPEQPAR